jgi:hypothetical protein
MFGSLQLHTMNTIAASQSRDGLLGQRGWITGHNTYQQEEAERTPQQGGVLGVIMSDYIPYKGIAIYLPANSIDRVGPRAAVVLKFVFDNRDKI